MRISRQGSDVSSSLLHVRSHQCEACQRLKTKADFISTELNSSAAFGEDKGGEISLGLLGGFCWVDPRLKADYFTSFTQLPSAVSDQQGENTVFTWGAHTCCCDSTSVMIFWWLQRQEAAQPTWSRLGFSCTRGLSLPTPPRNDSTQTETCTRCEWERLFARRPDLWIQTTPCDLWLTDSF